MSILMILVAYLLGSLPMGFIVIKTFKKQDITQIGSGRTGGANAMRAGGIGLGVMTGILDVLKGFMAVWLAKWLMPNAIWIQIFAGVAAVLGHNWSIILYLLSGRISAGAGTGPNVGAAMAFWPGVGLIAVPLIVFFVFIVGYASLASIAAALAFIITFYVRAESIHSPWEYILYALLTTILIIWALRSNIARLIKGTERRVGLFSKKSTQVSN